jgi:hypothetical protein
MPSLAMLWLGLCLGLLAGANARLTPSDAVRAPIILVPVRISCTMAVCVLHDACSSVQWTAQVRTLL